MTKSIRTAMEIINERNPMIVLGPRPGKKSLKKLQDLNLTHCVTLLSEREQEPLIAKICIKIPCKWIWLPIEGGNLEILRGTDIAALMNTLSEELLNEPNPRLYFHCSAGIHRTGFFAYTLLRLMGHEQETALSELENLRSVTAAQVGDERIDLAEKLLPNLLA